MVVLISAAALMAQDAGTAARRFLDSPEFRRAAGFIRSDYERFVRELIALTEIPAPPFKEGARAKAYLEMLRQHGLADVHMDPEGNVMGVRRGIGGTSMLAVLAHLDTVFPEGTDVTVKRDGTRLMAPGIGDDTRGLALVLAVIRAMDAAGIRTTSDILFVGNVGEEGEGDLRGVKYLLRKGKYHGRITSFLAVDGGDQSNITRGGVGSKRYRVVFTGPGGHSFSAFGTVNPAYAMAAAVTRLSALPVPATPRTTYNIGLVRGGTSVNAIPSQVSMDVDLRSESCEELARLDRAFTGVIHQAVAAENRARSTRAGRVAARLDVIGNRPCGATPMEAPIVQTTSAVLRAFGLQPTYSFESTDSNMAMSLGLPALTIGRGGAGGRSHSPDEWTDVEPAATARTVEVGLAIIVSVAGPA